MGNDDLTWEKQLSWNVGTDIITWNNRVTLGFDYYYKKTIDLVTEVSLPTSSGFTKYTDNMGEILNEGVELDLNVRAYSDKNWDVIVFGNLAHNKNKILKISESLKQYNERIDRVFSGLLLDIRYAFRRLEVCQTVYEIRGGEFLDGDLRDEIHGN